MFRTAAVALALLLSACTSGDGFRALCGEDGDCPRGYVCDRATGACRCGSDAACGPDEFCNSRGACQQRVGCDTSLDCPSGMFCDFRSGNCLDRDLCTTDSQCELGEVCDELHFRCVPGCRESGDCRLGQICLLPQASGASFGTCDGRRCDDDSFCRFGESCLDDGLGQGEKECVRDERGPYCQSCQTQPGAVSRCGGEEAEEANFCLLDRKVDFYRTYCGVDCSDGQACPHGYACRDILVLTGQLCQSDSQCPAGATCSFNEDSASGFCTCTQDADCPQEQCNPTTNRCSITRRPCNADGECERAIYCVNQGGRSACLVGKNCTPDEGLTCEDVRGTGSAQ